MQRPKLKTSEDGVRPKTVGVRYAGTLRYCAISSSIACLLLLVALCVAIGPALDWAVNYEKTTCLINNVSTTAEVECEIPQDEKLNANDQGLFVVPCVQINVAYTNSSGRDRVCDIAMPRRAMLLAECSSGSSQRSYNLGDCVGEPLPGPDGRANAQRRSTLTRALSTTRTCTFLDCRRNREAFRAIAATAVLHPCVQSRPSTRSRSATCRAHAYRASSSSPDKAKPTSARWSCSSTSRPTAKCSPGRSRRCWRCSARAPRVLLPLLPRVALPVPADDSKVPVLLTASLGWRRVGRADPRAGHALVELPYSTVS